MKFLANRSKKLTLLSTAWYIFLMAIIAKGVFLYASQHTAKNELLMVDGTVKRLRIGGQGKSTSFRIKSQGGTHMYSSYYGKVWPGMEGIRVDDRVQVLAERDKLSKNEFITGKRFYIWELIHRKQLIVSYDDIRELVNSKEKIENEYVNRILAVSAIYLLFAYMRKLRINSAK